MSIESVLDEMRANRTRRLTHAEAGELAAYTSGAGHRDWWMPGRDWKPSRESMSDIMAKYNTVDHPEHPVSVRVPAKPPLKGTNEVARYGSWAEYEAGKDAAYVPRGQPQTLDGVTVVLCAAKPWAGKKSAATAGTVLKAPRPSGSAKASLIGAMLEKGGVTSKELCEAVGWPSMSVPAQAKMVGLTLRKEKVDGVFRYWGSK